MRIVLKPLGAIFLFAAIVWLTFFGVTNFRRAHQADTALSNAPAAASHTSSDRSGAAPRPVLRPHQPWPFRPLLEYSFNGQGTTVKNQGSVAVAGNLALTNQNGPIDLHSAAGLGVSGTPGDKALDLSFANGMGAMATQGLSMAATDQPVTQADGLPAFTIMGWFKTSGGKVIGGAARILDNRANAGGYTVLASSSSVGSLQLDCGRELKVHSAPVFGDKGTWVAFAITVDEVANKVTFYRGTPTEPFQEAGKASFSTPPPGGGSGYERLAIGNSSGNDYRRVFEGMIDDIRVYDAVLTPEVLESLRRADVAGKPSP